MNNLAVKIKMDRSVFIWCQRVGRTLDAGCNDGSLVEGAHRQMGIPFNHDNDWLHSMDIDHWNLPNFTRGDICRMPFEDNEFDTVVMGDVLEHIPDAIGALKEADRVSKSNIVITLPNEYQWDERLSPFGNTELTEEQVINATLNHPSQYAKCLDYVSEKEFRHIPHVHTFDFFTIHRLLSKGLSKHYMINISNLYHPLCGPDDPETTPYWGILVDKSIDTSLKKHNVPGIISM